MRLALTLLLLCSALYAQTVSVHPNHTTEITWDGLDGIDGSANVVGWNIYKSETSGKYTTPYSYAERYGLIDFRPGNLIEGHTYYFLFKPVDVSGQEGSASNEIQVSIPVFATTPNFACQIDTTGSCVMQ